MSLQDEVLAAWAGLLKEHGFRKVRGLSTIPFGKDWLGVVGLNLATYNGAGPVDALPVVGVRWKPLGTIFEELNPKVPKSTTSTLSRPLYTLVPGQDGAQWRVRADKDAPVQTPTVSWRSTPESAADVRQGNHGDPKAPLPAVREDINLPRTFALETVGSKSM
ncbi:hypothetical protein [Arthrobacter yangruifuii]|uniref:hypothetical protein n=1 Tax=Arthrobacter yangruifuii TaxID=2606616 RepID=UPI0011B818E4|nr:hypothetical protein [Arthrobacter yangruifuii]